MGNLLQKLILDPVLIFAIQTNGRLTFLYTFTIRTPLYLKRDLKKLAQTLQFASGAHFVCLIIFWHLAALNISDVHVYAFWKLQTCMHLMGSMQFIVAIYFLACAKYGWFPMDWHVQLAIALQLQRNEKTCYLRGQTPDWLILKVSWWTLYSREV